MALENGVYAPKKEVTVTVWPLPDKNGDGEDQFREHTDEAGNYRRDPVLDDQGNQVRHYTPPDGFLRVPVQNPGSDGRAEVVVRGNGRGQVHRNVRGEAVEIREGSALVEYPDGTHKLLEDGYAQREFEKAHEKVSSQTDTSGEE